MIINGASRSGGAWFARHLTNADKNERVTLTEITGLPGADDIAAAFRVMETIADHRGSGMVKNYFYHANLNPEPDEKLTPEQWEEAIDCLERNLHLTGQPRIVMEHEKQGRIHRHVIWSRIDLDSGKAISDSLTASIHERTSRELEAAFGLKAGKSVLVPGSNRRHDKDKPKSWERFRGMESGIDPHELAGRLTALWHAADSAKSFAAAIEAEGLMLAKGDKPGVFLIIDQAGQEHSLVRRLKGVTTAQMRARMIDIDREALPDAATARAAQRGRVPAEPWQATEPQTAPPPEIRAVERLASDPPPQPVRAAQKAQTQRRRGRMTRYRRRQTGTGPHFRFPAWRPAPERVDKDPSLTPTRPPQPVREEEKDGIPFVNKPYLGNVNTLGPTPVQIPEDPAERAAYFGVQSGTPRPDDLKDARDRAKAGREQERRLKAAGRSSRLPPSLSARSRWRALFRKLARALTGRDIDTRQLTEAQRTRLAAEQQAERMAAHTNSSRFRAPGCGSRSRWLDRFRKMARRLTGRDIDTRHMSEVGRTEASHELIRQMRAADRESVRVQHARDREAVRVEGWRLRPRRRPAPD